MKKTIIAIVVVVIVAVGLYFIIKSTNSVVVDNETIQNEVTPVTPENKTQTVLGKSVNGRDIIAYHYGTGTDQILFVGGIHGGYEWNTALVAYNLMNYLKNNPSVIPANVKVTVVPVLNPDGLSKVVGTTTVIFSPVEVNTSQTQLVAGRFNGNTVDLNRNFDCDWQANAKWQSRDVSGGTSAFSEPESQAIKNYIEANGLKAVIVYYSAAGGVFSSSCHNGILAETRTLTNVYAKAAGYPAKEEFNFYEITGDMVNWLAKKNIPAISVLLTNHEDVEWSKNQAGIDAVLKYYAI